MRIIVLAIFMILVCSCAQQGRAGCTQIKPDVFKVYVTGDTGYSMVKPGFPLAHRPRVPA